MLVLRKSLQARAYVVKDAAAQLFVCSNVEVRVAALPMDGAALGMCTRQLCTR